MGTNPELCIPFERRLVKVMSFPPKRSGNLVASLLALVLPTRLWYPAVLRLSKIQAGVVRFFFRGRRDRTLEARILDRWLSLLSRTRCSFPIPWWTADYQALAETAAHEDGVIYCTANAPLVSIALRALADLGYEKPSIAVTCQPGAEMASLLAGSPDKLPILEPSIDNLYESHATLLQGGSVLLMADPTQALPYSPGLMRLGQLTGSRVVFVFAELEPDGHIEVEFQTPPDPFCASESSIEANLYALDIESQRILFGPSPARRKAPLEFPRQVSEPLKRSAL